MYKFENNAETPFIITNNEYKVITLSKSFSSEIINVKQGDDLLKTVLNSYKQAQWKDCVHKFINTDWSLEIKHILFFSKNVICDNKIIPIIQYWYLQRIDLGDNKIIIFHNNKLDFTVDNIFTNFTDYAKSLQNEVEFYFHRKARSIKRHSYLNPYLYAFFMPHLAKKNFHIAQGKLFRNFFNISADVRPSLIIQKELDNMELSDKSTDIRKFREKYLNKNFIPYAQITFPMILSIQNT